WPHTSSPSTPRFPVSISNRTQPKAQTSQRLSAGRPFACSGLMYAAVPRITPTPVTIAGVVIVGDCVTFGLDVAAGSRGFSGPKARTLDDPSSRTLTVDRLLYS